MGPFKTAQPVQVLDLELTAWDAHVQHVPVEMDNCLVYVYRGEMTIGGVRVLARQVARLHAQTVNARDISFLAGPDGVGAMLSFDL